MKCVARVEKGEWAVVKDYVPGCCVEEMGNGYAVLDCTSELLGEFLANLVRDEYWWEGARVVRSGRLLVLEPTSDDSRLPKVVVEMGSEEEAKSVLLDALEILDDRLTEDIEDLLVVIDRELGLEEAYFGPCTFGAYLCLYLHGYHGEGIPPLEIATEIREPNPLTELYGSEGIEGLVLESFEGLKKDLLDSLRSYVSRRDAKMIDELVLRIGRVLDAVSAVGLKNFVKIFAGEDIDEPSASTALCLDRRCLERIETLDDLVDALRSGRPIYLALLVRDLSSERRGERARDTRIVVPIDLSKVSPRNPSEELESAEVERVRSRRLLA